MSQRDLKAYWIARETGERLRFEALRLDTILLTYLEHVVVRQEVAALPPIDHHDILNDCECGCTTCQEWEARREDFIDALTLLPKDHRWSTCLCSTCRFIGRTQLNFMAATNSRDLLIEVAFYASHHSRYPNYIMAWLEMEMKRPEYTTNWRAQEMSRFPMAYWLRRCEAVVGPVISGAVFLHDLPARSQNAG